VYYVIYQIWFHPLANYPGPFLAKFTDLRAGYYAYIGDIHLDMWKCHQKYGMLSVHQILLMATLTNNRPMCSLLSHSFDDKHTQRNERYILSVALRFRSAELTWFEQRPKTSKRI
jgi:hypothetical protein